MTFTKGLDNLGCVYMLDIHSTQRVYIEKPEPVLPEKKNAKGREPKKLKASTGNVSVRDYIKTLDSLDWQDIKIRDSAKGLLRGKFHFKDIYVWDKHTNTVERRMLVVFRRKTTKGDLPVYLLTAHLRFFKINASLRLLSEYSFRMNTNKRIYIPMSLYLSINT
ncbi:MAG: hypothetical protein ACK5L5_02730 [Bacteroidales bacterium]